MSVAESTTTARVQASHGCCAIDAHFGVPPTTRLQEVQCRQSPKGVLREGQFAGNDGFGGLLHLEPLPVGERHIAPQKLLHFVRVDLPRRRSPISPGAAFLISLYGASVARLLQNP